jgi:glycosyltransferase involved in cell wall biosynthesis
MLLSTQWHKPTEAQQTAYNSTLGRLFLTVTNRRPFQYLGPDNQALASWFAKLVRTGDYDLIWISRALCAMALGWRDPRRTVLDGDDFDYVRTYLLLRCCPWYGAKLLNYVDVGKLAYWERQLPRWFARVTRCSEEDRQRSPARNVVVVPNGAAISPLPTYKENRSRLLFIGVLCYEPNRIGLNWFLEKIWPFIRQRVPSAELDVVGPEASPSLQARHGSDNIRVHGFVEDLTRLWQNASVSIAPLLSGGGTRLKILESLSRAVPVVSTTLGAYGLRIGGEEGLFRVDNPERFAAQCVELLLDYRRNRALGARGREAIVARYSWDKIQERIQGIVGEVVQDNRGHRLRIVT